MSGWPTIAGVYHTNMKARGLLKEFLSPDVANLTFSYLLPKTNGAIIFDFTEIDHTFDDRASHLESIPYDDELVKADVQMKPESQ